MLPPVAWHPRTPIAELLSSVSRAILRAKAHSMDKARLRVRPIRFAFAVDPFDLSALSTVFSINSALWGGAYNFILPLFKRVPKRYLKPYGKKLTARFLVQGLIEAFQPDFLVEMQPGSAGSLDFPRSRVIDINTLLSRDDRGRCLIGIDLRSIVSHLYRETFRFVQRHPPKVVIPSPDDARYDLIFSALFGTLPVTPGALSDCGVHFLKALDGERRTFPAVEYVSLLNDKYVYPLNVVGYELDTKPRSWSIDSKLYYMNERSPLDLIDFWNLSALGWDITPLPASLAPKLTAFCEQFVETSYRAFPPPSNAHHHASFLCSPECSQAELHAFIATLRRTPEQPAWQAIGLDTRVPRIWEEWGRSADHAEPQTVTYRTELVEARLIGNGLHLSTAIPEFAKEDSFASVQHACANVLESVPGGAQVIPWGQGELRGLFHDFEDERTWVSREGIITTSAEFSTIRTLRAPTGLNIFSTFAKGKGLSLSVSPAGDICTQIIKALGGIESIRIVARSPELLHFLNSLAHENIEVESDDRLRKIRKAYAPYSKTLEIVRRATPGPEIAKENFFQALINTRVLSVGLALRCQECNHTSWHALDSIAPKMVCPRCFSELGFPGASPPRKEDWAYRVSGPFAAENFAHGAYCVASTLHLLTEKIVTESTWIPSFRLIKDGREVECDFGMFARPSRLSHATRPFLVLGECKTFGVFTSADFTKARYLAETFPGSVLCFSTFRDTLTSKEIKALAKIVRRGRLPFGVGKIRNPVLVLTGQELFSQFAWNKDFYESYGPHAEYARQAYMRRDIEELCSLTQEQHLGIESYSTWLRERHTKHTKQQAASAPSN